MVIDYIWLDMWRLYNVYTCSIHIGTCIFCAVFPDVYIVHKNYASSLLPCRKKSKNGEMSLKEAIDDSENLTDFLMDFEEDE